MSRVLAVAAGLLLTPPLASAQATAAQGVADPRITALVASVSPERLQATATKLASFGTRSTLSDTVSTTRGIGAARRWIYDEFKRASPKLQVAFDRHMLARQGRITREVELVNVVAILPGRSARRIYISGHYDAVNPRGNAPNNPGAGAGAAGGDAQMRAEMDHNADAPGANDDGSGTALTMELARAFANSGLEFDATLVFVTCLVVDRLFHLLLCLMPKTSPKSSPIWQEINIGQFGVCSCLLAITQVD